ncbi:spore germination protein [Paenibacillus sp. CC-CFT747]|nr:spore germination protein [Paenibacillus sp. CC-CFT747]
MKEWLQELQQVKEQQSDFTLFPMKLGSVSVYVGGFRSLVDMPQTLFQLQEMASACPEGMAGLSLRLGGERISTLPEAFLALAKGKLLIVPEDGCEGMAVPPVSRKIYRGVEESANESVVLGPLDAFNESLDVNIGILRSRMNSRFLQHESFSVGSVQVHEISLFYLEGRVHRSLLRKVRDQLTQIRDQEFGCLQEFFILMGEDRGVSFPPP